jgi:hypothetical protein
LGQNGGCATGAQQILTQHLVRNHAGAVDEVGRHGKVKAVRRVETCMPCQDHDLVFAHPAGQPVGQSCTAEIVKFSSLARSPVQDVVELPGSLSGNLLRHSHFRIVVPRRAHLSPLISYRQAKAR